MVHDAGTARKLGARIDVYETRMLNDERSLLAGAEDDGWEIHSVPASFRGDCLPAPRWLLLARNDTGRVDPMSLRDRLERGGQNLAGRVLFGGAAVGGPVSSRLYVWFGDKGWGGAIRSTMVRSRVRCPRARCAVPHCARSTPWSRGSRLSLAARVLPV